jgi:APA family basic amino acid/polyamine antiporter
MTESATTNVHLRRELGARDAVALVVGSIIGTGVFIKTAGMTQAVGSPGMVLLVWCVAGALSLTGALVYAELGVRFPRAGGEYVFLREGFGKLPAFLYGWMRFWIGSPGSIAAYGVGCASFAAGIFPEMTAGQRTGSAQLAILAFTLINCFAVMVGGAVQSILTWLKIILVAGLALGLIGFSEPGSMARVLSSQPTAVNVGFSGFATAMIAALWAFDGWNNMPMAAGEIRDPGRSIPRALVFGSLICLIIYTAVNFAYFVALPVDEVLSANSSLYPDALPVATVAAKRIFGETSSVFMSVAFVISALGAMNGSILTGARVPYAMARDGVFFQLLGKVGQRSHVPVTAVVIQGLWAAVLAGSGSFDQLTNYVVFSSWIFYAMCALALFRFRGKQKEAAFLVPGYPLLPLVFIAVSALLLIATVASDPVSSLTGLALIAAGIPFYWWNRHSHSR